MNEESDVEKALKWFFFQIPSLEGERRLATIRAHIATLEAQHRWIPVSKLPEPYAVVNWWDGKEMWFGHYDCATQENVYYFGRDQLSDKNFTHWRLLPTPPAQEER